MPSNEQRRQAAKRKLERQLARRAERARRRRIWGVGITVVVVVGVVGLVFWLVNLGPDEDASATPTDSESTPNTTDGPCAYAESSGEELSAAGLPEDPAETPSSGTVAVTLNTNQGAIPLTLDRAQAACTVQSIEHLAANKFYDGTTCHRLTTGEGLQVLQCGDPNGDGSGGPGYTIPDELPTDLAQGPTGPDGSPTSIYPRGTVAMANAGPNTGGSQFFLVYADSTLPPNYTVFGTIGEAGLTVLDAIAAGGVGQGGSSAQDGPPALATTIETATVG